MFRKDIVVIMDVFRVIIEGAWNVDELLRSASVQLILLCRAYLNKAILVLCSR